MPSAFGCLSKIRRLPTGMGSSSWKANSLCGTVAGFSQSRISIDPTLGSFAYLHAIDPRDSGFSAKFWLLCRCWRGTVAYAGGDEALAARALGDGGHFSRSMDAARFFGHALRVAGSRLSEQSDAECAARLGAGDR